MRCRTLERLGFGGRSVRVDAAVRLVYHRRVGRVQGSPAEGSLRRVSSQSSVGGRGGALLARFWCCPMLYTWYLVPGTGIP